jgi:hypothetical protein
MASVEHHDLPGESACMGGSVGSCKLPPNGIEVPLYVLSTPTMPMVHTQRNDIRARLDVGANMVSIDQ